MDLVDAHSHFFSRSFFDALAGGDELALARVGEKTGIEIPPPDVARHTSRWLDDLDRKGVSHLVTFASLPEEVPSVREAVALAAGRISACALVNPGVPKTCAVASDPAFAGVLLFPAMHHFHIGDAEDVLGVLDDRRGLVFVHCGLLVVKLRDLFGHPRPYDLAFANPLSIVPAANRYRNIPFVVPHFGAGFFRETLMLGTQCENAYVDTSSTNSWIRTQPRSITLQEVFERTLDVYGPERLLFGTDSNVFPAGWRRDRFEEQRAILERLGLREEDRAAIFGGNVRRLLSEVV